MTKSLKVSVSVSLSSVSCFVLLIVAFLSSAPASAAASSMKNPSVSEEIAIFLNGQLLISKQKAYNFGKIKDSGTYVPVKLLSKVKHVEAVYGKTISVKSPQGTYQIDKSNSVTFEGTTYITLKKFLGITGVSGKYLSRPHVVFLWSSPEGKTKTDELESLLKTVPADLQFYLGDKVFVYAGNQTGWITEIKSAGYGMTECESL